MINEHERAVLTVDLPKHGLEAGDVGTVVHVYADCEAYEIEFFSMVGDTLDVVTIPKNHVRQGTRSDVLHVRRLSA